MSHQLRQLSYCAPHLHNPVNFLTFAGIANGTASYNPLIIKLELSSDVHPLLGPTTTKCPVSAKAVSKQRYRYACDDPCLMYTTRAYVVEINAVLIPDAKPASVTAVHHIFTLL